MSLRTLIIAASVATASLSGCSKKTEAELAELERAQIREEKRQQAIKAYNDLAEKFPQHEHAKEAPGKAQALSAQAPK